LPFRSIRPPDLQVLSFPSRKRIVICAIELWTSSIPTGEGNTTLSKLAQSITAAVAAFCLGSSIQSAQAGDGVAAGVLTCAVKGGDSFIFGSTRELRCLFQVNANDPGFRYGGKIQKFGLDIGVTEKARLAWTVFAPTDRLDPGALAGTYAGVAAGAAVGVGGSANVLIGGSNNTISLQPLSLEGETGLNAAAAVASVELFPFPDDEKPLK
jgi:hypothetical protein